MERTTESWNWYRNTRTQAAALVYTSDAKLRTRVKALGTQVMGSRDVAEAARRGERPQWVKLAPEHSRDPADDAGRDHRVNGEVPTTPTTEVRNRERLR